VTSSTHNREQKDFTKVKLSKKSHIQVQSSTDAHGCCITDLAVLPGGLLLLADNDNQSVKLVDPASGHLLDELQLSSRPRGVCLLPGDSAVVTLPDKKRLQIISVTTKKLDLQRIVSVEGLCYGVDVFNDLFVVGFRDLKKITLVDMFGHTYKSISTDSRRKPIFKSPEYICVMTEKNSNGIYVSDWGTKTITRLSEELQVLQSFTDPALRGPRSLATVGGG